MINTAMGITSCLITLLINYTFLKCVLKKKAEKPLDYLLLFGLFVINSLSAFFLDENPFLKLMLIPVSYTIVTIFVFRVSFKKSILANTAFFGLYGSVEMLALFILERAMGVDSISDITLLNGGFVSDLIAQFVILGIVLLLNIIFRKGPFSSLDLKGWFIFALFPIFTLISVIVLINVSENNIDNELFYGLMILSTGMLILNILLFILLDNVIKRESEMREKEIMLEQASHLNQMYRSLSDEREKQKARSHDYMNHLQVMLMLAREGKIDEQISYIEEQVGQELQSVDVIDTGNTLINAVLNIKYLEAKTKGIIIPFIADNLTGLKISDSDLVTILTNILDNAIDAVSKCEEKRIVFKIIRDNNTLIIDSLNTYSGQIADTENFVTTKTDKKNHGFGIANIRKTVEANNGNCFIDTEGGIFHISIAIPQ
ncbi:MAG: GHKL domain-containing protein [Saccharofermentans sp.]|nr:GHKL domain-containing protein [Saccharofermentans sp.]